MAGLLTDKITETFNGQNPTSTTVSGSRAISGSTLTCTSLAGWPTNTAVHFATYKKDGTGAKIAGSQVDWKGVVSGSAINSLTRQGGATDSGSGVGDIVEMMPTYSWANDLAKGLENTLNQDGSLRSSLTVTSPVFAGTATGALTSAVLACPYQFFVYRSGAQNTGASGFTKILFDTEIYDTGNNFDSTTNNRFTIPVTGHYSFSGGTFIGTTVDGTLYFITLYRNGSEWLRWGGGTAGGTGGISCQGSVEQVLFTAGDFVELFVFCSGTAQAMQVGNGPITTWFSGSLKSLT